MANMSPFRLNVPNLGPDIIGPPSNPKKRRKNNQAPPIQAPPNVQDLLPPTPSGYGDTIIASNPFDDCPSTLSSMTMRGPPMGPMGGPMGMPNPMQCTMGMGRPPMMPGSQKCYLGMHSPNAMGNPMMQGGPRMGGPMGPMSGPHPHGPHMMNSPSGPGPGGPMHPGMTGPPMHSPIGGMGPMQGSMGPGCGPMGGPMGSMNGPMNGPMSSPMGGPMNSPMNSPMNGGGPNNPMNGPISGPMTSPMHSPMNTHHMNSPMNGPMNGPMSGPGPGHMGPHGGGGPHGPGGGMGPMNGPNGPIVEIMSPGILNLKTQKTKRDPGLTGLIDQYKGPPMNNNNFMMSPMPNMYSKPMPVSAGKVYPADQPMVFNSQNPNAPPIYPCGVCHKEVHDNDQAILCESGCNFWFHRGCTGLTEHAFQLLTAEVYAEWVCDKCLATKNIPLVKFKP
ncbi:protein pygopus-like isoform X2 [Euwallacea fornicatus]|uniref:protein pygopus-like isoform X2 n=1 Tax=Euwallacea fornicatus TaxID=995702 RepID=UPI00338F457D